MRSRFKNNQNPYISTYLLTIVLATVLLTNCGQSPKLLRDQALSSSTTDGTSQTQTINIVDGVSDNEHRIFLTSNLFLGSLGGVAGADATCDTAADAAGLLRTYKAVISSSTSDAISRISIAGPVYMYTAAATRVRIATQANFFSAVHEAAIGRDEYYNVVLVNNLAWSATDTDGTFDPLMSSCSDWTDGSVFVDGTVGNGSMINSQWITDGGSPCDTLTRLYCISQ